MCILLLLGLLFLGIPHTSVFPPDPMIKMGVSVVGFVFIVVHVYVFGALGAPVSMTEARRRGRALTRQGTGFVTARGDPIVTDKKRGASMEMPLGQRYTPATLSPGPLGVSVRLGGRRDSTSMPVIVKNTGRVDLLRPVVKSK